MKCYEQLVGVRLCPEQKQFDGLSLKPFQEGKMMLKMSRAVDSRKRHPTQSWWTQYATYSPSTAGILSE
jgi:hypothetical protein